MLHLFHVYMPGMTTGATFCDAGMVREDENLQISRRCYILYEINKNQK
jgi:hypothetical protein